ncbi:MAG: acetyl-CoA decarbonylase/synthase complex subunit delta [Dehalococcoidales bacterium]
MPFESPRIKYNGRIREAGIGQGENIIRAGGQDCYPFHSFEGTTPNLPKIAMEVYDCLPEGWPAAAIGPFKDVIGNPSQWAQKCVTEYGANMICLQLAGTDPNWLDRSPEEAARVTLEVAQAIDVPLIVWGTANQEKDSQVLTTIARECSGKRLVIGPVEEKNYKSIADAAMQNSHLIIASSPIDINLAKQLNILIANTGIPANDILIDPTVSSVGYGIEYCYSVMERIRIAALTQQDDKLQMPIICNVAREAWKAKEAKIPAVDNPALGDEEKRGILLEAVSAMVLLLAGGDIMIMRHPEAIRLVKEVIGELAG